MNDELKIILDLVEKQIGILGDMRKELDPDIKQAREFEVAERVLYTAQGNVRRMIEEADRTHFLVCPAIKIVASSVSFLSLLIHRCSNF